MSTKKVPKKSNELQKIPNIVKMFNIMGWFFLIMLIIDLIYILLQGFTDGLTFYTVALIYSLLIFTGLCFGTASQFQKSPMGKKIIFRSFIISIIFTGILIILVFAAYQW